MLGEDLDRQGGVVAVQKLILGHMPGSVRILHIPTLKDGSGLKKVAVFLKAVLALIKHLTVDRIDLVHIHVSTGGSVYRQTVTSLIALAFKKHLILHAHSGKFPSFFERQPKPAKAAIALVFRRCDRLLAVSHHWRGFYAETLGIDPRRIVVLPNPVAVPATLPERPTAPPVKLVFFGLINQAKGVFDLLQATATIADGSDQRFHLWIAGGGGELDQAKALALELGVTSRVTFLGWVGPKERDEVMADADIFLLPSYFEGLPMSLLEAMSWGLAPITTPVGGIPDIIDHEGNGLLVQPGEIAALAAAMERLIDDAALRERLGLAARQSVEPFDVKPYVAGLNDMYRMLGRAG